MTGSTGGGRRRGRPRRFVCGLAAGACAVGLLFCLTAGSGCATSGGGNGVAGVRAKLRADGMVEWNGDVCAARFLAAKFKSGGAGPNTEITIDVPIDSPAATLAEIHQRLRRAGFSKVLFVRPRTINVGPAPAGTGKSR